MPQKLQRAWSDLRNRQWLQSLNAMLRRDGSRIAPRSIRVVLQGIQIVPQSTRVVLRNIWNTVIVWIILQNSRRKGYSKNTARVTGMAGNRVTRW